MIGVFQSLRWWAIVVFFPAWQVDFLLKIYRKNQFFFLSLKPSFIFFCTCSKFTTKLFYITDCSKPYFIDWPKNLRSNMTLNRQPLLGSEKQDKTNCEHVCNLLPMNLVKSVPTAMIWVYFAWRIIQAYKSHFQTLVVRFTFSESFSRFTLNMTDVKFTKLLAFFSILLLKFSEHHRTWIWFHHIVAIFKFCLSNDMDATC